MIKFIKSFFKEKEIITFSCKDWAIRKYSPVELGENKLPEEYMDLPVGKICPFERRNLSYQLTARQCPSINSFLKYGYVISAWCDIEIDFEGDNVLIRYSNQDYSHDVHTENQYQKILGDHFDVRLVIKINNPWHIKTIDGYSCFWLPIYYTNKNYQALPGILDTDMTLNDTPINLAFFEKKHTLIKMGEPLVRIIPFRRESIDAVSRKYNGQDENRFMNILGLNGLSRYNWRGYISAKNKFKLTKTDLDIES
jgi:hypothetical protein